MATKAPLGNGQFGGILVVLTVSADQFASFVTFECPCDRDINQYYALTFLLGPSIILFLMALLKQQMFWRLGMSFIRNQNRDIKKDKLMKRQLQ